MPRETWTQILARLKQELRSRDDSDFDTRCRGFLRRAFSEITASYRFYIYDGGPATLSLTGGTRSVSISGLTGGLRYVSDLRNNTLARVIKKSNYRHLDARDYTQTGAPRFYARYADTLEFDTTADQTYSLNIRWRKLNTDPDFSSGTPETPDQWDDVIFYRAVMKGCAAYLEPERAPWYEDQMNKLITEIPDVEDVEAEDDDFGLGVKE